MVLPAARLLAAAACAPSDRVVTALALAAAFFLGAACFEAAVVGAAFFAAAFFAAALFAVALFAVALFAVVFFAVVFRGVDFFTAEPSVDRGARAFATAGRRGSPPRDVVGTGPVRRPVRALPVSSAGRFVPVRLPSVAVGRRRAILPVGRRPAGRVLAALSRLTAAARGLSGPGPAWRLGSAAVGHPSPPGRRCRTYPDRRSRRAVLVVTAGGRVTAVVGGRVVPATCEGRGEAAGGCVVPVVTVACEFRVDTTGGVTGRVPGTTGAGGR